MNTVGKFALLTVVAGLAACSDSSTAPRSLEQPTDTTPSVQGSTQDLVYGSVEFSITIDPSRNTTYNLGAGNSLYFPAGSLCSLNSSYGTTEWDKPCTKATSSVTVKAKAWLDSKGKPRVDFDKHIRFVPTNDPAKYVVIQFADLQASLDPFFNILYCPTTTGACINEAKTDLSLLTVRNPLTRKVTRRIKHFSGYNVAAGEESGGFFSISIGDLQLNAASEFESLYGIQKGEAEQLLETVREAKRSGYILASG